MQQSYNFNRDLAIGKKGELFFINTYKDTFKLSDTFKYDLFHVKKNLTVEVKSDQYKYDTGNIYIEVYSDIETKKPGGLLRAYRDNVDKFYYLFINQMYWLEFNVKETYEYIQSFESTPLALPGSSHGPGGCWTTAGYPFPINKLEHLYKKHLFKKKEV